MSRIGNNITASLVKSSGYSFDEYNNRVKEAPTVHTFEAIFSPADDPITETVTEQTSEGVATLYIRDKSIHIEPTDTIIIDGVDWYQESPPLEWRAPKGFRMNRGGQSIKIRRAERSNV